MSGNGASAISAAVTGRLAVGGADGVTSDETLALLGRRVAGVVFPGALDAALGDLLNGLDVGSVVDLRVLASSGLLCPAQNTPICSRVT
jgi:hypothetical protein